MEQRIDKANDIYYNLELILLELAQSLKPDAIEYLRMHLYTSLEKMQNPQILHSLNTITIFEKLDHGHNKSTTQYINYIKEDNGIWRVQTGERFSELKNLLTHTEDENITYYLNKDFLLAADVSTFHNVEHCFKERESVVTTTIVFENGEWDEKFTRRSTPFEDTVVQHVKGSLEKVRRKGA